MNVDMMDVMEKLLDKTKLRPIGSKLRFILPPLESSTDTRGSLITYEITKHIIGINPDTRKKEWMEELKTINIKKISLYTTWNGKLRYFYKKREIPAIGMWI